MAQKRQELDVQKWENWGRSLDLIEKQLLNLCFVKGMFERLDGKCRQLTELGKSDRLWIYLNNTYVVYVAMAIRRLTDKASKGQNLYRLLEDLRNNHAQVTAQNLADYHVQQYQGQGQTVSQFRRRDILKNVKDAFREAFDRTTLTLKDVQEDIAILYSNRRAKVVALADKCIAHMDKPTTKIEKTIFSEVHGYVDDVLRIYNKYSLMLGHNPFTCPDDVLFGGWDDCFVQM